MRWSIVGMVTVVAAGCGPVVAPPAGTAGPSSGPEPGSSTSGEATRGDASTGPVAGTSSSLGPADTGDEPRLDLPPDVDPSCIDYAFMGCGMPSDRGAVTGTTPLGEFTTTRALFGAFAGCGGGSCEVLPNVATITLFDASVPIDEIDPWGGTDETLVIILDGVEWGGFQGPAGEPVLGLLQANRGGVSDQTGQVEVVLDLVPSVEDLADPFDPATAVVVTGSVTVDVAGWSVTGTFAAPYCPDLNTFAICE
jgi:hypothetical protein